MRSLVLGLFIVLAGTVAGGQASETRQIARPTGKVILTIDGSISHTNSAGAAQFDLAALETLGMHTIETSTPWHKKKVKFSGPKLQALLKFVGARGNTASVTALNDYAADIPISDFAEHQVILASRMNGKQMPVSNKGPLFVMYPFDENPQLNLEKYYSRAVWQVVRITVMAE